MMTTRWLRWRWQWGPMALKLEQIILLGRSFDEYRRMFALSEVDLTGAPPGGPDSELMEYRLASCACSHKESLMYRFAPLVAFLLSIVHFTSAGRAADRRIEGTVKSVDPGKSVITLSTKSDGK